MGDRSNVFIQMEQNSITEVWSGIGLYSHWGGKEAQEKAIVIAKECTERLGDSAYFTRRLVHKFLNSVDPDAGETGHGLWTDAIGMPDNEHKVLVINAQSGEYWYTDEVSFQEDAPKKGVRNVKDVKVPAS